MGLSWFLIALQNSSFAQLYLSLAHPSSILHQRNSLCFWLCQSGEFCSHLEHLSRGPAESKTWKMLAPFLCSAYAVREGRARSRLWEVPAFPGDQSYQQVLQRSVWEMSLYLQPGQRWNAFSDKDGWKCVSPMISSKPLQPFKARCALFQHLAAKCSSWPLEPLLESA